MSQRLQGEGVPMHEFRATTQNFSPAIIELDAAMRAARLRHDGNPVLSWCIGNVVGRADRRGNLYPTKSRPDQKIDAAVALMMAMGRAMVEDEDQAGLNAFWRAQLPSESECHPCGRDGWNSQKGGWQSPAAPGHGAQCRIRTRLLFGASTF
jgi:phage terminase large subunit-like protein